MNTTRSLCLLLGMLLCLGASPFGITTARAQFERSTVTGGVGALRVADRYAPYLEVQGRMPFQDLPLSLGLYAAGALSEGESSVACPDGEPGCAAAYRAAQSIYMTGVRVGMVPMLLPLDAYAGMGYHFVHEGQGASRGWTIAPVAELGLGTRIQVSGPWHAAAEVSFFVPVDGGADRHVVRLGLQYRFSH